MTSKKATAKRDPWFKFYVTDWRGEPRLKLCSRAARSFWLDLLGIMHEARPYGFLLVEGIAPDTAQLASLTGDPEKHVRQWMDELKRAGVPSITGQPMPDDVAGMIPDGVPDGTILSRRMVRDAAKREADRENGKGGGNPKLVADGITGGLTRGDNPKARRGLKPRSQKPESRNTPNPPVEPVKPPPTPHASWEVLASRAVGVFGQRFCDYMLFPAAIVPVSASEVALEASDRLQLTRIRSESQRLHDLLGKTVIFRLATQAAA